MTLIKIKSKSPKDSAAKLLKTLPESSTFEDIQYHLYVLQKIDKGLSETKSKKVYSSEEVRKKLGKWIKR